MSIVQARNYGRFGNVAFQVATCISYGLKHNLEISVQTTTNNTFWNPIYFQNLRNDKWEQGREDILINENVFGYEPIEFKEEWRGKQIVLNGYFQSEKFFKEHRAEILYLFDFPKVTNPIICLHARFGDYLTVKDGNGKMKHIIIDEPYIISAIKLVKEKTGLERIKVFSDDIPYFKANFGHLYDFEYSTNANEVEDITEMSCCHSFIGSSSTFSWWAAWLSRNEEKVIVTQKDWFHPDGWMDIDTSHIVPETWIKL
jgi:hypothetical protein